MPGFVTIFDTDDAQGKAVAERAPQHTVCRCDCWDCVDNECSGSCETEGYD